MDQGIVTNQQPKERKFLLEAQFEDGCAANPYIITLNGWGRAIKIEEQGLTSRDVPSEFWVALALIAFRYGKEIAEEAE